MPTALRSAITAELSMAREGEIAGRLDEAFAHLERAHILSQRFAFAHAGIHLQMWRLGWKRRDWREVAGQLPRTLAALLFSRLWVPPGNTGGANVSAFRSMPVPPDLQSILDAR